MSRCRDCKYAILNYCEYYGGGKQYFVDGCERDVIGDEEPEECEEFAEVEEV